MPKKGVRARLLAQRRLLLPDEFLRHSRALQERFLASPVYRSAGSVALYSPVHGEAGTDIVFRSALEDEKVAVFPEVVGDHLVFRRVSSLHQLKPGGFGVLEPGIICPEVDVRNIDVVVVPAVGFDLSGNRIGYGKGYYDRALHLLEGSGRLAGFSFDFQVLEEIAGEPHDVKVDWIFTESRVVQVSRK